MKDNNKMKNQYRVNGQIHVREVRVVSDNGSEVMPTRQALDMARQQGVDLVEISPNAQPPVCRIIDYSKFLYQQKKRQKEMKQKQVKVEVKEIRFGPQTDAHDYQFKLKHAQEFLEEGNKVRAYVFFRGRSILSRSRVRCFCFALPMTWKSMPRLSSCPVWRVRRCSSSWLLRRQVWLSRASRSAIVWPQRLLPKRKTLKRLLSRLRKTDCSPTPKVATP